jgi:hypothetical protein
VFARLWTALAPYRHPYDVALATAGVAFAAVSVAMPFGRDQGLYYYVGREWLHHGAMPYRDAFEQKTPAIFFLHAVAIMLFGEHMASIRVLELGCIVALGIVCARLATPMGERVPPGVGGASVLAAAVMYIGIFGFWDTAQCEIWCTTAALGAACVATRSSHAGRGAAVGGLLAGVALLFKPPGAMLVALAGLAVVERALQEPGERRLRRAVVAAVLFSASAAAPIVLVVAYFAAKGALPAMIDVLVGANGYYVQHERGVQSLYDVAKRTHDVYKLYDPLGSLLLEGLVVGLSVGIVRRDKVLRDRHAFALLACIAGFVGVLSQLKFYLYHWGLVVGPATLVASNLALDAVALAKWRAPARGAAVAVWLYAFNFVAAYALTGRCVNKWLEEVTATKDWLTHKIDREQFSSQFEVDSLGYNFRNGEQVGLWLRAHVAPGEEVVVRGFEPEIYTVSGCRYGGRFFWTSFLTDPRRAYRREEFLAQDRAQLLERSPRWVVALSGIHEGPDAPEFFTAMGYVPREEMYGFTLMEKEGSLPEH